MIGLGGSFSVLNDSRWRTTLGFLLFVYQCGYQANMPWISVGSYCAWQPIASVSPALLFWRRCMQQVQAYFSPRYGSYYAE
jgi:hypothetical protein